MSTLSGSLVLADPELDCEPILRMGGSWERRSDDQRSATRRNPAGSLAAVHHGGVHSADADVLELLEYAGHRLLDRLSGIDDGEWSWTPLPSDTRVSIRWRLDHIAATLADERNWRWLGADPAAAPTVRPASSSDEAVATLRTSLERFVGLVRSLGDAAGEPIGPPAGPYAAATRRSFVLHVVDELVHHGAEAALLRDLAAGRPPDRSVSPAKSSGRSDA